MRLYLRSLVGRQVKDLDYRQSQALKFALEFCFLWIDKDGVIRDKVTVQALINGED